MGGRIVALAMLFCMLSVSAAKGQVAAIWPEGEPRESKWRASNLFAVGINPVLFGDIFRAYRAVPITKGESFLTRDSHLRFGGYSLVSPLLAKVGPMVGISPLLICDFDFVWNQYLDVLHYKFDSIHDKYDQDILDEMNPTVAWGQEFLLSSTFKAAYGGVILVDILDTSYILFNDTFYSIEFVTIVTDGIIMTNKVFLLYELEPGIRIGFEHEWFHIPKNNYNRHMVHFGTMLDRKLPLDMTLLLFMGYHVENLDFDGFRFWTAVSKEWDL